MNPSELFELWAPQPSVWSRWAKPILFAELSAVGVGEMPPRLEPLAQSGDGRALAHKLGEVTGTALVLDLPSATSVKTGLGLVEAGFRPVPLFNGNLGPRLTGSAIVDNGPIVSWLVAGAAVLAEHPLPSEAPPAFLLDSRRRPQVSASPGRFDNRWIVFPQDFPSARFLQSQGITRAVLIQEDAAKAPQEDLAHVLRRWQEAGVALWVSSLDPGSGMGSLQVNAPSRFRALWYEALAVAGLRRNSAGGFGSIIPQPSSGTG